MSSSTDPTFAPPSLFAGSLTLIVSNRGFASSSSPRSLSEIFLKGFFLAFMIFGSEAYRGSIVNFAGQY